MGYLQFVFAGIVLIQSSYGYHPKSASPEKFKLTSHPKTYYPDHKSENYYKDKSDNYYKPEGHYEDKDDSKDEETETKYYNDNKGNKNGNYEFYKPLKSHHSYGLDESNADSDSHYIPHSKEFSKYLNPKVSSSKKHWLDDENANDDVNKNLEVPKYGFNPHKDIYINHKHYETEAENLPLKHSHDGWNDKHQEPFRHDPKYGLPVSQEKHKEYKHHEPKYGLPNSHENHEKYKHHEPKYGLPNSHENHEKYKHHEPKYGLPNSHENHEKYKHHEPKYGLPQSHEQHEEYKHHEPKYGLPKSYEQHKEYKHHESKYGLPASLEKHKEHKHHELNNKKHKEYANEPGNYANRDKEESLRYQHWSDKDSGAFPNSKTLLEEIGKEKSHYLPTIPGETFKHSSWLDEKSSYVPQIEDLIKEQGLHDDPHKYSHDSEKSVKPHHKIRNYKKEPKGIPSFLKQYPHINKYYNENHFKSFKYFKPEINFGGHHYSWMYKPKVDFYKELKKDMEIKMRLLKEHQEKLAQLQKGHLNKYHALFKPHYGDKFLNHDSTNHEISNTDHKYQASSESHKEKVGNLHSLPNLNSDYDGYPNEPHHSHKPKYQSHYEISLPKHEGTSDHPQPQHHHNHKPHHYKDEYAS